MNSFLSRYMSAEVSSPFLGPTEMQRLRGANYKARLGANECLFGASAQICETLRLFGSEISFYTDSTQRELRLEIARLWKQPMENVLIGNGIEGLLDLFLRAYIDPGDKILKFRGSYPAFDANAKLYGADMDYLAYDNAFCVNVDELISRAKEIIPKIIYLCSPDNPTGASIATDDLQRIIENVPDDCTIFFDEAYSEYSSEEISMPRQKAWPNVIRFRTFSKFYGLAGARIGYVVAAANICTYVNRIRPAFSVSSLSQALAGKALSDTKHAGYVYEETKKSRIAYIQIAQSLNIECIPSEANFVSFIFPSDAIASDVAIWLESNDIFVSRPATSPLNRLIRVTVGGEQDCIHLENALAMAKQRSIF